MRIPPIPPEGLARYVAAALFVSMLPMTGQTIPNPGFEANTFTVFPGYVSANSPGITGWTAAPTNRAGLNPGGGTPFANNGAIPEGVNVAFIQGGSGGTGSLSTTATGLTIGTKYKVSMRINARYQTTANAPNLVFSTDGSGPTVALEVSAVSNAINTTAYKTAAFEFTATAASQLITLTNNRTTGDHTLLIDDVTIAPSDGAWSFAPWTGDADSGIDSKYIYPHAYSFGSDAPVTINGVNFIGREAGVPGRFTLTDLGTTFANRTPNNVTGESAKLAKDFRYSGANTGITLDNLKPNTAYVFSLYGIGFDATGTNRSATFSSSVPGSQKLSVNLTQYGQGNGIVVNYTYTTDALGTPVSISYPATSAGTYHTSGFSNREATPATQPELWTLEPWTDDSTSGVSPNHVYTHAINFGAATSFNLNGINFTGVAGASPVAPGLTVTGMPGVYNNDANTVTGYGAAMAKDFIHSGFPGAHTLTGLTPGKDYVYTIYSMGWNDGSRPIAFIGGAGEQATILNQDTLGDNQGLRFVYHYKANAAGTAKITFSAFDGVKSLHTYGMSNREANAMVAVAPVITLQPIAATVGEGSTVVLRVGATGSDPLSYQWKRNGTNIPGGTEPVLDLGVVNGSSAGIYTVVVTNGSGSATSDPATLGVLENVPGVFGTGLGVDGQPLAAGAPDPHFTLLVNPDNRESDVAVTQSNIPGSWFPNSTTSKWIGPRADSSGAAAMSSDDGEGLGTYVYRTRIDLTGFDLSTVKITGSWATDNFGTAIRVNGTAVTGLVNDTGVTFGVLKPFAIDPTNAPGLLAGVNTIDFVVNNSDAATGFTGLRIDSLSAIGLIPPNTPPHIVLQPASVNGPHGGQALLAVAASGSKDLSYQWYKGTAAISGATQATLLLEIVDYTPAGDYKVVVSNGVAPAAESAIAKLSITNVNPVVVDDSMTSAGAAPLPIAAQDLVINDTDADGDVLQFAGFSATSFNGGTITEDLGILTYTPAPGFSGLDGFTYFVKDEWGGTSAPGSVLITVTTDTATPPGQLTLVVDLAGGAVTGSFTGTPGVSYVFERSTTLVGAWVTVATVVAPESGLVSFQDSNPPAGKAFYRIAYPQ